LDQELVLLPISEAMVELLPDVGREAAYFAWAFHKRWILGYGLMRFRGLGKNSAFICLDMG